MVRAFPYTDAMWPRCDGPVTSSRVRHAGSGPGVAGVGLRIHDVDAVRPPVDDAGRNAEDKSRVNDDPTRPWRPGLLTATSELSGDPDSDVRSWLCAVVDVRRRSRDDHLRWQHPRSLERWRWLDRNENGGLCKSRARHDRARCMNHGDRPMAGPLTNGRNADARL